MFPGCVQKCTLIGHVCRHQAMVLLFLNSSPFLHKALLRAEDHSVHSLGWACKLCFQQVLQLFSWAISWSVQKLSLFPIIWGADFALCVLGLKVSLNYQGWTGPRYPPNNGFGMKARQIWTLRLSTMKQRSLLSRSRVNQRGHLPWALMNWLPNIQPSASSSWDSSYTPKPGFTG